MGGWAAPGPWPCKVTADHVSAWVYAAVVGVLFHLNRFQPPSPLPLPPGDMPDDELFHLPEMQMNPLLHRLIRCHPFCAQSTDVEPSSEGVGIEAGLNPTPTSGALCDPTLLGLTPFSPLLSSLDSIRQHV